MLKTPRSEIQMIQTACEQAFRAKSLRDYPTALASAQWCLAQKPLALVSSDLWKALFNAPEWFSHQGEDEKYLRYADQLMISVLDACKSLPAGDASILAKSFVLGVQFRHTTHNELNLRSFMARRAQLFNLMIDGLNLPNRAHHFSDPVSYGSAIRLGVMFKHLANDPELTSVLPYFEKASGKDLKVIVFLESDSSDAQCKAYVEQISDEIIHLPASLAEKIQAIRCQDLDILIFGNDITAKPSSFALLSFFRLARLTACCVSTLVTTASPNVDLYFGSPYYLNRGAEKEFHERFVTVTDPGFAFWYPKETDYEQDVLKRSDLDLPEHATLLVSGANHTKIHGDLIAAWATILRGIPSSFLLLYPFPPHFGPSRDTVIKRIREAFRKWGVTSDRILILSPLPGRASVVRLLSQMDLGLDSFPYPGVSTMVNAVEAELPTVTMAGKRLRNSQGACIMHSIGLDELITENKEEYITLAINLALDKDRVLSLKNRLAKIKKPFFQSKSFSTKVSQVYRRLYQELESSEI